MTGERWGEKLLLIGGTLLAVGGVSSIIDRYQQVPPSLYLYLALAGLALCGLGLVILFIALIASIQQLRSLGRRLEKLLIWVEKKDTIYNHRSAHPDELQRLREFVVRLLGENITPLETMELWYRKNPNIFHII